MMQNLIVYYSLSGNNEKLAYELKNRTGYEIFQVHEKRKRKTISILLDILFKRNSKLKDSSIDLGKYQKVIFVSPVWNGKVATPMRAFLGKEKKSLSKYFYISVCDGETGQEERLVDELFSLTDRRPQNVANLSINSLLPEEQRHKIRHTFNYRISPHDLQRFQENIESFISSVGDFK
jgi:flavodoxin